MRGICEQSLEPNHEGLVAKFVCCSLWISDLRAEWTLRDALGQVDCFKVVTKLFYHVENIMKNVYELIEWE